jgi:outer membrane protein TolC
MQFIQSGQRGLFTASLLLAVSCFLAVASRSCGADEKATPKDRIRVLLKERVDTAKAIHDLAVDKYNRGAGTIQEVHRAKMAWLNAQFTLAETKGERLKISEEIVKDAKEWEETARRNVEKGVWERMDALNAKAYRVEAEIALELVKAEIETIGAPKK